MSTRILGLLILVPRLVAAAEPLVFEGVHVVPMDREVVLEGMTVVVEEGRIAAMGKEGRVAVPPGARRVSARGRYLLPGLADMHVHMRKREVAGRYLAYGFTTVRDMAAHLGDARAWRDEAEAGTLVGPRIIAAGYMLFVGAHDEHPLPVRTPEQARRAVRETKAAGFDLVKVYRVEREPFLALMDEARELEIPVAGHHPDVVHDQSYDDPLDLPTDEVLASGVVSLEHLDELITAALRVRLEPDAVAPLARQFRARGVAVTTLLGQDFEVQRIRREGDRYLTEEREREVRSVFGEEGVATMRERIGFITTKLPRDIADLGAAIPDFSLLVLRTFHEQGVELLIGTDSHSAIVPAGRSGHDELALFVEAGLRPYDALRAATVNAARVLGRLDRLGTVAVGKEADLVLAAENPLEDLGSLRRPLGVVVRGRYLDEADLDALRSVPPSPLEGRPRVRGSGRP